MKAAQELSPFDRSTLVVWKLANVAGWSAAALAAGVLIQMLILNASVLVERWWTFSIGEQANLAAHVLSGVAIGSVIGRRVFRSVGPIAGGLAALHAFALLGFGYAGAFFSSGVFPVVIGAEVIVAVLFAERARRKRPLALRGGRNPR